MNILFITNGFPQEDDASNGMFIYHRYKRLKALGHNVVVCKLNHLRDKPYKAPYSLSFFDGANDIVEVVNYYQVPKLNIYFKLVPNLIKILEKYSIDIVHSHFATQSFAAYRLHKATGIPYVITGHGSGINRLFALSKRYSRITRKAIMSASEIIYVSESLKKEAHALGLKRDNESIIYNGVEVLNIDIQEKMARRNLNKICFVGELRPKKRAQYLPEIFNEILKLVPLAEFTIIGNGISKNIIENKLLSFGINNKVRFTGSIPQERVYEEMVKSDLLLLPSIHEAFGCVLIEAMMCGSQVVVSDNGGMPEAVGNAGSIVPDSENWIENFAIAVSDRLKNPVDIPILLDQANRFNWNLTVEKEIEVYRRVLSV